MFIYLGVWGGGEKERGERAIKEEGAIDLKRKERYKGGFRGQNEGEMM